MEFDFHSFVLHSFLLHSTFSLRFANCFKTQNTKNIAPQIYVSIYFFSFIVYKDALWWYIVWWLVFFLPFGVFRSSCFWSMTNFLKNSVFWHFSRSDGKSKKWQKIKICCHRVKVVVKNLWYIHQVGMR